MRITFDTNCVDKVVRPHLSPKDPRNSEYQAVSKALESGLFTGAFSETIVTIEGIKKADRAIVFGSTRVRGKEEVPKVTEDGTTVVNFKLFVEQLARSPLEPAFAERVQAALRFGLKILRAPRIGMLHIKDPDRNLYVQDSESAALSNRLMRYLDALEAIETRGLGFSRLERLAAKFAARAGAKEPWHQSLGLAADIHEERAVERAFAEWSDADSIAAHIGYGFDAFCTEDLGNTGGDPSVFDATNRSWLNQTYGVKFVSLSDLASLAQRP